MGCQSLTQARTLSLYINNMISWSKLDYLGYKTKNTGSQACIWNCAKSSVHLLLGPQSLFNIEPLENSGCVFWLKCYNNFKNSEMMACRNYFQQLPQDLWCSQDTTYTEFNSKKRLHWSCSSQNQILIKFREIQKAIVVLEFPGL